MSMEARHPAWLQKLAAEGRVSGLQAPAVQAPPASRRGGRAIRKEDGPSKTEAAYAREVLEPLKRQGVIREYWHEPVKFRLADRTWYTPDYMVMLASDVIEFIEVKGRKADGPWCEEDARVKFKVAADLYPFTFRMVWPRKGGGWHQEDR